MNGTYNFVTMISALFLLPLYVRYDGKKSNKAGDQTYDAFSKTLQRAEEVPTHLRFAAAATTTAPGGFMGQMAPAGTVQGASTPAPSAPVPPDEEPW